MGILDSEKTQSLVGIANLAQNRQINKSIKELMKSQEESAEAAKRSANLQKEANNLEKERLAAQRDTARSAQIQLKIAQQAEERKILFSAKVCKSLDPAGTLIVFDGSSFISKAFILNDLATSCMFQFLLTFFSVKIERLLSSTIKSIGNFFVEAQPKAPRT